jgi:hypothetical protein
MAVSASDPAYLAEVTPSSFAALGKLLCRGWRVGPDAFGARGNLKHTKGYHRSRRYNMAHTPGDYSVQLAADRAGDEDWVSAFDFTPGAWGTAANRAEMVKITKRMRAAARARDPRVRALREFAGTENGTTVVTIDMQTGGDRSPFDSSHLDHGHGSIFRAYAAQDHTGIYEVMAGIPAGGTADMDVNDAIPGVPGLTLGTLLRDVWTHAVVERGLTLDANGIPQRHPSDRWTQPHLLTHQTEQLDAIERALDTGGGSVEVAAIAREIQASAAETQAHMTTIIEQLRAENAELRGRLATAYGPGSE